MHIIHHASSTCAGYRSRLYASPFGSVCALLTTLYAVRTSFRRYLFGYPLGCRYHQLHIQYTTHTQNCQLFREYAVKSNVLVPISYCCF